MQSFGSTAHSTQKHYLVDTLLCGVSASSCALFPPGSIIIVYMSTTVAAGSYIGILARTAGAGPGILTVNVSNTSSTSGWVTAGAQTVVATSNTWHYFVAPIAFRWLAIAVDINPIFICDIQTM